jgi:hypothetical protein
MQLPRRTPTIRRCALPWCHSSGCITTAMNNDPVIMNYDRLVYKITISELYIIAGHYSYLLINYYRRNRNKYEGTCTRHRLRYTRTENLIHCGKLWHFFSDWVTVTLSLNYRCASLWSPTTLRNCVRDTRNRQPYRRKSLVYLNYPPACAYRTAE